MTNEELIAKIRTEIERLIEESDFDESANLYSLLSFLSTLEEQPKEVRNPIFDECVANVDQEVREEVSRNIELDEELERFIASGKSVTVDDCGTYKVSYHDFKKVARHFAEWQKEQDDRLAALLEAEKYATSHARSIVEEVAYGRGFKTGFIEGYKQAEKDILAIIQSRLSDIIGDAQPKPALRAELQELIKRLKEEKK